MKAELFECEILASMAKVHAFENHPYNISFYLPNTEFIIDYLVLRVLADGKFKNKLSARLHHILEAILPDVQASHEDFKHNLRLLVAGVVYNHRNCGVSKILGEESKVDIVDDTFEQDRLCAAALLGIQSMFDSITSKYLQPKASSSASNMVYGAFKNSTLALAAQGGQFELLCKILDASESACLLPLSKNEAYSVMYSAALYGRDIIIRHLLQPKYGFPVHPGRSDLPRTAASFGNLSLLQFLCERFGMSLGDSEIMRVASSYDRLNIVEISLANGGDANKFLLGYESPLAAAALRGHGDMVRFLLSKGADPNYQDERWHALLYAAKMGHAHVVKILWEAGATPTRESRWSPLTRAAQHGHCHVIETFLDLGHSIEGKYKEAANEALCRAAAAGHESIVRLLVKRGVGKDGNGKNGSHARTPMIQAWTYGQPHIISTLLELGAQPIDPFKSLNADEIEKGRVPSYYGGGVRPVLKTIEVANGLAQFNGLTYKLFHHRGKAVFKNIRLLVVPDSLGS